LHTVDGMRDGMRYMAWRMSKKGLLFLVPSHTLESESNTFLLMLR
jgi:hypothetical protein